MLVWIGLELNNEGRVLAWALDFPGCFAYGQDGPEAIVGLARALVTYENWITRHAGPNWLPLGILTCELRTPGRCIQSITSMSWKKAPTR